MTYIKIEVPNDDTIALRQFGKALIEIASEKDGHPVDVTVTPLVISTETLQQAAPPVVVGPPVPVVDTTAQQVESLATHIIISQEKVGDPVDLGDGNLSQGYRIEMQE